MDFSKPVCRSALASGHAGRFARGMTIVPRFVVDWVAGWRVGRLRQRLRHLGDGAAAQQQALRGLLARFERTDFGRTHGLTARTTPEEFRARVPLRTTAEFRAWTERMAGGEENVLAPGRCRLFAYTAGTTEGSPRLVPVTPEQLEHFRGALTDTLLLHAARVHATTVFHGRHLHAGGSTQLGAARGVFAGHLDAMVGLALSGWAEKNLYAPTGELARLPEGPEKTAALAAAWAGRNVRLAAGSPSSLLALAEALGPAGGLHGAWPQLECLLMTGASPLLHHAELLQRLGSGATLHEAYTAVEGFFAAQDGEPGAGQRLLADAGVYLEFLPLPDIGAGATEAGSRCVPLGRLTVGEDYALVVTTPAGLCRCLVGDAVRVVSTTPPRVLFLGRTAQRLDAFGEGVDEHDLTVALLAVCARNDWQAVNFHVAPYLERPAPRPQGSHEWWIELRPGTVRTPTGPLLSTELDTELGHRHHGYAGRRANGALNAPVVRLVIPGTFAECVRLHPPAGGPGKFPRCRGDRLIADQLAGIARFHQGTQAPFVRGAG